MGCCLWGRTESDMTEVTEQTVPEPAAQPWWYIAKEEYGPRKESCGPKRVLRCPAEGILKGFIFCTTTKFALISHASKVMLKILQVRFQQYMNRELTDVQAGFKKGRGTRDQIANICWIMEKARDFQKTIYFCFIDHAKASDCVDTINCGKFFKRWKYQTTYSAS